MKTTFNITVICLMGLSFLGCKKYADDYKGYLNNKEVVYPGLAKNVGYQAGNLRAVLFWNPSPDPSIKNYVIKWNNGADSLTVDASTKDPSEKISVSIPNLKEYVYSFKIFAHDADGNVSVGQELNNVRVYGPAYRSTLLNRVHSTITPYVINEDGSIKINFNKADTTNFSTTVRYTNTSGAMEEREIPRDNSSITLPNYKSRTLIQYRSSYKPQVNAIDTFQVSSFDNLPIECDKSLFAALRLPTDIRSEYSWELPYLWDNKYGEPGFHTPGTEMPQWISMDMGIKASLISFKVWQRMSSLYDAGNIKRFEVWGSNAPAADGSWESWTKLGTYNSYKPSGLPTGETNGADKTFAEAGESFLLPTGTPEVRYIRIKVLETWGNKNYFHIIELTFYKQNK